MQMASGPGRAIKDGVLGSAMATGPGRVTSDGVLGGPLVVNGRTVTGPFSLQHVGGLGGGCGCSGMGTTYQAAAGLGGIEIDSSLLLGAIGGAVLMYFAYPSLFGR